LKASGKGFRTASKSEIEELRDLAVRDLITAGLSDPPEQAIQSRLNTLASQRQLLLPNPSARGEAAAGTSSRFFPGLALVQTFCQEQARQADLRTQAKRQNRSTAEVPGKIPYYFAAVPDDYVDHFARYLPPTASLLVLILYRYAKVDMETWVSQDTLVNKAGVCENTLKRDMGLLIKCKVIQRVRAGGIDFRGNPINKTQGYKYRLNAPLAWDRKQVRTVHPRKPRKGRPRKKKDDTDVDM
jgi:hypothetical protein